MKDSGPGKPPQSSRQRSRSSGVVDLKKHREVVRRKAVKSPSVFVQRLLAVFLILAGLAFVFLLTRQGVAR